MWYISVDCALGDKNGLLLYPFFLQCMLIRLNEEAATITALKGYQEQKKHMMTKKLEEMMKASDVWFQIDQIEFLVINGVFVLQKFPVSMER